MRRGTVADFRGFFSVAGGPRKKEVDSDLHTDPAALGLARRNCNALADERIDLLACARTRGPAERDSHERRSNETSDDRHVLHSPTQDAIRTNTCRFCVHYD
jgi:hypothetical protein